MGPSLLSRTFISFARPSRARELILLSFFLFAGSDNPESVPPMRDMTSTGLHATVDAENKAAREPTDKEVSCKEERGARRMAKKIVYPSLKLTYLRLVD